MKDPESQDFPSALKKLDEAKGQTSEAYFSDELVSVGKAIRAAGNSIPQELVWEVNAFGFWPRPNGELSDWGTHYGPSSTFQGKDGRIQEIPSRESVTPEALKYWMHRAISSTNPVMKARYADLVWDFGSAAEFKKDKPSMAAIVIDATLEIAKFKLYRQPIKIVHLLRRALQLSLLMRDSARKDAVIRATLGLSTALKDEKGLYFRLFAFEILVLENGPHFVDEVTEKLLITEVWDYLKTLSNEEEGGYSDPHGAAQMARMLSQFYRRNGENSKANEALTIAARSFEGAATKAGGLLAPKFYEDAKNLYQEAGNKAEASRNFDLMKKAAKDSLKDMKSIGATTQIPVATVEAFVLKVTTGSFEEAVGKMILEFVADQSKLEERIKKQSETAPFQAMMTQQLVDQDGICTALVGSVEEDLPGRKVRQCCMEIQFESIFLRKVIEGLCEKKGLDVNSALDFIKASAIFDDSDLEFLRIGLNAYFAGHFAVALHLIPARIEAGIRRVSEFVGLSTLKSNRNANGGYDRKTLDELLRQPELELVYGPDALFYLRTLFTDRRGFNLRNEIYHGIFLIEQGNQRISDSVFHALMLVGSVRKQEVLKSPDDING